MIRIHEPWITEEEKRFVSMALDSGWISGHGDAIAAFETEFSGALGLPQAAVSTVNGSAALILALRSLPLPSGFRALVSDNGFIATANAVVYSGATPVFLGPDAPDKPVIAAERVARALERDPSLRVVLYNQPFGFAADMADVRKACDRAGAWLVEDSSQALGIRQNGRSLGSFGHAGCWSLNGNKTITTGMGGVLHLEDPKAGAHARKLRLHGRSDAFEFQYEEFGYNFQLSNLLAAYGRAQLARVSEILRKKEAIHAHYQALFAERGRRVLSPGALPVWLNLLWLEKPRDRAFFRDLAADAAAAGVQIRPAFPPVSSYPMYAGAEVLEAEHSRAFYDHVVCLPSGPALGPEEISTVVKVIDHALARLHA